MYACALQRREALLAGVSELGDTVPVARSCEWLGLSRATFYRERSRLDAVRSTGEIATSNGPELPKLIVVDAACDSFDRVVEIASEPSDQASPIEVLQIDSSPMAPRSEVEGILEAFGLCLSTLSSDALIAGNTPNHARVTPVATFSESRCTAETELTFLRSANSPPSIAAHLGDTVVIKSALRGRCPCNQQVRLRRPNQKKPVDSLVTTPKRHHRRLGVEEEARALAYLTDPLYVDSTPIEVYYALLTLGVYLCSPRTLARILERNAMSKERRRGHRKYRHRKPQLVATGPGQIWSWDITTLPSLNGDKVYKLYVVMDIFSRYVVGWMLADTETGELAKEFMLAVLARVQVIPGELVIHSDRGSPMTSQVFKDAMGNAGVDLSYSRPRVSDDNPFSEALFKTAKYCSMYPGSFACDDEVRQFCTQFFSSYNEHHHHAGLNYHTPSDVHHGRCVQVAAIWQDALDEAFLANPSRFARRAPLAKLPPGRVAINLPCGPVPPPIVAPHAASHEVRPRVTGELPTETPLPSATPWQSCASARPEMETKAHNSMRPGGDVQLSCCR